MPFALRRPAKIAWLPPAWTPIFLPIKSFAVWMGVLFAIDPMANGFFWYWAPMTFSGACELIIAAAVMGGDDRPTVTFSARINDSAVADVPPASNSTASKPALR